MRTATRRGTLPAVPMPRLPLALLSTLAFASPLVACGGAPLPAHPIDDARRAIALHASLRSELHAMQAVARVEQRGSEGRVRGTVWALIGLPERLRFDVMTSLGPVATLTSDGGVFALLDQREGRYFEGPSCAANVARFLGVAIEATEVATLLVGGVPVDQVPDDATITPVSGGYDLVLPTDGGAIELRFGMRRGDEDQPPEGQHLRLVRLVVRDADGDVRLRIAYDDYRVVEDPADMSETPHGIAMPFVVRIEDRARDSELVVRFTEIALNGELVDDAFVQSAPAGLVVEESACDGSVTIRGDR